jgi:hypothetical protein
VAADAAAYTEAQHAGRHRVWGTRGSVPAARRSAAPRVTAAALPPPHTGAVRMPPLPPQGPAPLPRRPNCTTAATPTLLYPSSPALAVAAKMARIAATLAVLALLASSAAAYPSLWAGVSLSPKCDPQGPAGGGGGAPRSRASRAPRRRRR